MILEAEVGYDERIDIYIDKIRGGYKSEEISKNEIAKKKIREGKVFANADWIDLHSEFRAIKKQDKSAEEHNKTIDSYIEKIHESDLNKILFPYEMKEISAEDLNVMANYYGRRRRENRIPSWDSEAFKNHFIERIKTESASKKLKNEAEYFNSVLSRETISAIKRGYYTNEEGKKKKINSNFLSIPNREEYYSKKRKNVLKAMVRKNCDIVKYMTGTQNYACGLENEPASMKLDYSLKVYL
ncbi:Uncharacterised protein [uncultured archaeon]|nr:Uncharacterised protein [uncultured archaeon]